MKRIMILTLVMVAGVWLPVYAQQSLAEAARKAREQKKELPQAKHVYTNDDLPSPGAAPVSTVGSAPQSSSSSDTGAAGGTSAGGDAAATKPADKSAATGGDEAAWRKKFSELRAKIAAGEKEIDVLQREWNLKQQQYYTDPNVAMREQNSRGDINDTKTKIDDKRKELDALKQQLAELEDDLRRAGGPSSWSRE